MKREWWMVYRRRGSGLIFSFLLLISVSCSRVLGIVVRLLCFFFFFPFFCVWCMLEDTE